MKKFSVSRRKCIFPRHLSDYLKCTARTVRDYCKAGKIPEAVRTPGGHWRIRLPLSARTKEFLHRVKGEWPFDGSKPFEGEFESDVAGWLMDAQLYKKDWQECSPAPDLADLRPSKREAAAKIHAEISKRLNDKAKAVLAAHGPDAPDHLLDTKALFSDMHLFGFVYQVWLKSEDYPTVEEIAGLMCISRTEFYRLGHTAKHILQAYAVCERIRTEPDLPS